MEEEIWKDVVNFEGLYKVNQWGDIWSEYTHKKIKYSISNYGYKQYNLHKDKKAFIVTAHKAVAQAFVPNPLNLPIINHKDENKLNCYYENLEWCTYSYNNSYNNKAKKAMQAHAKTVYQYDKNGELINIFNSVKEAARKTQFSNSQITACCQEYKLNKKNIKTVKGFVFSFIKLTKEEVTEHYKVSSTRSYFLKTKSKQIQQLNLNGDYIQTYNSCRDVERVTGFPASQVSRAARGYEKSHTCRGFKWKYL